MCRSARDRSRLRLSFFVALGVSLPGISSVLLAQSPSAASASSASSPAKDTPGATDAVTPRKGYRIGTGDVLQIVVYREPDASIPDATVRSDGKISMPMLGEVEVQGLTPSELEKERANLRGWKGQKGRTDPAGRPHDDHASSERGGWPHGVRKADENLYLALRRPKPIQDSIQLQGRYPRQAFRTKHSGPSWRHSRCPVVLNPYPIPLKSQVLFLGTKS
jgi:hypothetical protein